jgi:outer membrane protein
MKKLVSGAFAAALLATVAVPAFAGDLPSSKSAPLAPVVDDSFDPFLIRLRGLAVIPDASGSSLKGRSFSGATLNDQGIPEADLTYFLTKHWAVEVIAGVSPHYLTAPATLGSNINVARTTLLPPTVTLQYHFALGQFDPYVGVGPNYTWFLGTTSGALPNSVNVHSAAGVAFQAGADYYLTKHWVLNVDAKYLLLDTTANIGTAGGAALSGRDVVKLNINPWLVGAGIGYRFGTDVFAAPVVAKY